MPDSVAIGQFERRLVELGCPTRPLRERVRELGDHYLDLKEVALADGLSEVEAEAQATERLGNPVMLAENLIVGLRRASWWGRHPILGFCVLPIPVYFFVWAACLGGLVGACGLAGWMFGATYNLDHDTIAVFQGSDAVFSQIAERLKTGLNAVSCVVMTLGFCWLVRRSAAGWKWLVAACVASYVASLCFYSTIEPHNITLGLGWTFPGWGWGRNYADWWGSIPLVIGVVAFIQQCRRENQLASIPKTLARPRPILPARAALWRRLCLTPTYWIFGILAVLSAWGVRLQLAEGKQADAHQVALKNKIWPAERAATLAALKNGQSTAASSKATTIDLQPWLDATLATSLDDPAEGKDNGLMGLPGKLQTFAGEPFDVAGRIQLAGQIRPGQLEKFPVRVNGIGIGRKCDRLYLLHGAARVSLPSDRKIARLVIHYQNGAKAEIGIVPGRDVLDWWGPIYESEAGDDRHTSSPGTELAWAGSNPKIQEQEPDNSLRLYRSTFANPHPELEIKSIDYVSALTGASPFLVGLTVE